MLLNYKTIHFKIDDGHPRIRTITKFDVPGIGLPLNNPDQREAISMALSKRFSLIHGPPGTGKTNTAIKLIYLFNNINKDLERLGQGKKHIVFCGPSNKSVDVVAVRLFENRKDNGPKIARLYGGSLANSDFPIPGKCYPSRKGSSDDKPEAKLKSLAIHHIIRETGKPYATAIAEFEKQMEDKKKLKVNLIEEYTLLLSKSTQEELTHYDVIFCTTAMATNTSIFKMLKNQIFQLIIDECGMCTEPECLATIVSTRAEQVVLIGDHMQLKPIIQCQQAQRLGLEESMFESYYKCQIKGKNSVQLTTQYRMHESICKFPSKRFYNEKLVTGLSASYLENQPLQIWGHQKETRHIFCHVEGEEEALTVSSNEGNEMSRSNVVEVKQVMKIFKFLYEREHIFGDKQTTSKPRCTLNIMSQYKAQCNLITRELEKEGYNGINVNTVNGSQGGEWDYVIFSLVRSLPQIRIERYPTQGWTTKNLGFITDENQINVALTRARKGLFVIGNQNLLRCNRVWNELLDYYSSKGCVFDAKDFPMPIQHKGKKKRHTNSEEFQFA
ncbi:unnamed protein product [Mytilus coruscus]|uniref:Uncharacterized protein n=1 Tax=Mytilus coruscus TaxID=42192 RepID=A0A6J8CIN2_MYTCO|nr:unnamed protein product [Mytilus coruscus]